MTANEYLISRIQKYDNNHTYNANEENAFNSLKRIVQEWFNATYPRHSAYSVYHAPSLEVQKSGSRAKGTAIKGSSDMDMFLSITDRENEDRLKDYYDSLYLYLKRSNITVRKQNVSIGATYNGFSIDLVPAKKSNQSSYTRDWQAYNDHWLWSNKKQQRTKTNIQKHIDLVRYNRIEKYVMLTKIWRNNHGLDFPSIYIELLVKDALEVRRTNDLATDFLNILKYIRDIIVEKKVVDPSNSNNIISDTLTNEEKLAIKKALIASLSEQYWESVIW